MRRKRASSRRGGISRALAVSSYLSCITVLLACEAGVVTGGGGHPAGRSAVRVVASVETDPVPSPGDAADDPCLWLHPRDPSLSLVVATDKRGGLAVYDLRGKQIQYLRDGRPNNVDLRYNFPLGGRSIALVTAGDTAKNRVALYRVDPERRRLEAVATSGIEPGLAVYGSCMYRSPKSGRYYVFATSYSGSVEQWEIFDDGKGSVDGALVRRFRVGGETEGCVADDELGFLYLAEEDLCIWKYDAEAVPTRRRRVVDRTGPRGYLAPDIEGLALYYGDEGRGYLIASSQDRGEFVIYRREGENEYAGTFRIVPGKETDGVTDTDGIDVSGAFLGDVFPGGVFIAQDGSNYGKNQNFKLVSWKDIAEAMSPPLTMASSWDPRAAAARKAPPPEGK